MKNNKILTVVVPIKDCESQLKNFLRSLPYKNNNFEILLIYYQSNDKTFKVAKLFQSKNTNIFIKECKKNGIYPAMNLGIDFSRGKYILFIGADDIIYFDNLKKIINSIKTNVTDIFITPINVIHKKYIRNMIPKDDKSPYMFHHQSLLFSKDFLKRNSIKYNLNYKIHSDFDFIQKCFNRNCKYKILNVNPLVGFNLNGKSTNKKYLSINKRIN